MSTAFISHQDCKLHEIAPFHPESPDRLTAIEKALREAGLMEQLSCFDATPADRLHLLLAHAEEHVDFIFSQAPSSGTTVIDADTSMNPHSLRAALLAAGAGVQATELVYAGKVQNAFCSVRPPGHHAEYRTAMGFCLFNSIAIAARYAVDVLGLSQVAIVDFDVHHGNGTEDIVGSDARILFCSTFQHPFYPDKAGSLQPQQVINVPLSQNAGSREFREAVSDVWLPSLDAFKPEFVFISAGFDAHSHDPLAQINLEEDDFYWVTKRIKQVANDHAQSRIVSMLEGGYELNALGRCVATHIRALLESE